MSCCSTQHDTRGCRSAFEETKHELLAVEGHKALLSDPSAGLLQAKLALRAPYITPLNILQVCSLLPPRPSAGSVPTLSLTHIALLIWCQVYCLKELRELDATGKPPAKFSSYVPEDPEVRALLSRDRAHLDDPYKAAISDTLIITMKGVAAGSAHFPRAVQVRPLLDEQELPIFSDLAGVAQACKTRAENARTSSGCPYRDWTLRVLRACLRSIFRDKYDPKISREETS